MLSCSFYLYRFRKYVSYGFPIINFCNPGVYYETPCIIEISSPFRVVSEIILSSVLLLGPHKVSISYSSFHSY
jgi:hypothetical protein